MVKCTSSAVQSLHSLYHFSSDRFYPIAGLPTSAQTFYGIAGLPTSALTFYAIAGFPTSALTVFMQRFASLLQL